MTEKVMNVSFVLFTFFYKFNFFFFGNNIQNLSRIFYVRNLSRFVYPEFVQNFLCSEFVQVCLSRICPEFFMSGICLEFVLIYLSRICPEFLYWTNTEQFLDNFWMKPNSKYCICVKKMDDFRTCKIYSGQFLDIFDDIFRTFSFYRAAIFIKEFNWFSSSDVYSS